MSLLLNLINYSSSMQSQYSLSLPNMDGKDNRSRSLCLFPDEQENKKSKISSKSLSKILNEKPQQTIDPKTRILHRIGHSLSIKCKKHFYAFFVTLQTLKKKDLYLTSEGEFQKMENRKVSFKEKDTKNKEKDLNSKKKVITLEEKKNILGKFVQKMEQLNRLILIKEFEQHTKGQFFHSIKNNHLYKDSVNSLASKLQKCIAKLNCYRVFRNLKKINQYAFKIEILSTLMMAINKKYNKINPFDEFDIKESAFNALKNSFYGPKITVSPEKISKTDVKSQSNLVENITNEREISVDQNIESNKEEFSHSNEKSLKRSAQSLSNEDSQILIKAPLESLEARVLNVEQRKFERNEKNMLRSYTVKTCMQEEPMQVSANIKADKSSNFCNKIAKNYLSQSANDEDEQFNTIFTSTAKRNSFSSRFKESKVTPYMSGKFGRSNQKNLNLDLSSGDERGDDFTISQISGITLLKTDKSTSTLINDKSFNFSNAIGTECVNFKNSLVQQRQSLKETDKNFTKKRPANLNKSQVQGGVFTKSFLRSTIDNKTKAKFVEPLNAERHYSSNKGSQFLIRQDGPFTDVKPQSRAQQIIWARTSSHGRQDQKRIETEMDGVFKMVNMSIVSNQNVYPTRDVSGVISIEQSIKSTPYVQKQVNEKGDKQKSFIKLLSNKKDTSMISKS